MASHATNKAPKKGAGKIMAQKWSFLALAIVVFASLTMMLSAFDLLPESKTTAPATACT
jgi:hypothetical protein